MSAAKETKREKREKKNDARPRRWDMAVRRRVKPLASRFFSIANGAKERDGTIEGQVDVKKDGEARRNRARERAKQTFALSRNRDRPPTAAGRRRRRRSPPIPVSKRAPVSNRFPLRRNLPAVSEDSALDVKPVFLILGVTREERERGTGDGEFFFFTSLFDLATGDDGRRRWSLSTILPRSPSCSFANSAYLGVVLPMMKQPHEKKRNKKEALFYEKKEVQASSRKLLPKRNKESEREIKQRRESNFFFFLSFVVDVVSSPPPPSFLSLSLAP